MSHHRMRIKHARLGMETAASALERAASECRRALEQAEKALKVFHLQRAGEKDVYAEVHEELFRQDQARREELELFQEEH